MAKRENMIVRQAEGRLCGGATCMDTAKQKQRRSPSANSESIAAHLHVTQSFRKVGRQQLFDQILAMPVKMPGELDLAL